MGVPCLSAGPSPAPGWGCSSLALVLRLHPAALLGLWGWVPAGRSRRVMLPEQDQGGAGTMVVLGPPCRFGQLMGKRPGRAAAGPRCRSHCQLVPRGLPACTGGLRVKVWKRRGGGELGWFSCRRGELMAWPSDPNPGGGRATAAVRLRHRVSWLTETESSLSARCQARCQTLRDKQGWCLSTERVSNLMHSREVGLGDFFLSRQQAGAVALGWDGRSSLTGSWEGG